VLDLEVFRIGGAMTYIYISGGIGNQLFQVGFGHYLHFRYGITAKVRKLKLKSGLPHTNVSFFPEKYFCEHCRYEINSGNESWNELTNPWLNNSRMPKLRKRMDFRDQPFVNSSAVKFNGSNCMWLGYFQNYDFISPIENVFRSEILKVIEMKSGEEKEFDKLKEYEVIHIRQGDTKSPTNMKRVGVLDHTYYKRNLSQLSDYRHRLVVTDDVEGAREVLKGIKVDDIYGPDKLDAWESLSLMARSRRLIVANSTFSWWGGFLAIASGAEVVIPKPFFNSAELETNGAFKYPGFTETFSSFLE
jgi:Glycosyl transferase family 11